MGDTDSDALDDAASSRPYEEEPRKFAQPRHGLDSIGTACHPNQLDGRREDHLSTMDTFRGTGHTRRPSESTLVVGVAAAAAQASLSVAP